jgi:hypothetical protein
MFCCHHWKQLWMFWHKILLYVTLTNVIHEHNITIAIIRAALVTDKFISTSQHRACKQRREHTSREFIFYLLNMLTSQLVPCM